MTNFIAKTTGEKIRFLRENVDMTIDQLAENIGVDRTSVYRWESDSAVPRGKKITALARLFEVPESTFKDDVQIDEKFMEIRDRSREIKKKLLKNAIADDGEMQRLIQYFTDSPELYDRIRRETPIDLKIGDTLFRLSPQRKLTGDDMVGFKHNPPPRLQKTGEPCEIPLPPAGLNRASHNLWLKNYELLNKWNKSSEATWIPSWALKKFLQTNIHFYSGGSFEDITGLLKEITEEGNTP